VIDNGSGQIKAGFAGAEAPKTVFSAYVGKPKHIKVMAGAVEGDVFIGPKAVELRGMLKLSYPSRHGVTTDWKDMQLLFQHAYNDMNAQQDQHPVMVTEAPLNPKKHRTRVAELFFETFAVPALHIQNQAILSLYASGRTTGVVLESGDGVTCSVPVYEGFAIPHAIQRIDVAGRDVTEHLQLLLRKAGYTFHTSAELEIVRDVKERRCMVAFNIEKQEKDEQDGVEQEVPYKLPDGTPIYIGAERFRAPEILFNPGIIGMEYVGIHTMLHNSINRCDLDIRRGMYADILLSGGSTLFEGFGDRLLSEMKKLAPKDTKIQIWAPPDRIHSTWVGGSILASLATFKKMWLTKKDYDEGGKSAVHRKFF